MPFHWTRKPFDKTDAIRLLQPIKRHDIAPGIKWGTPEQPKIEGFNQAIQTWHNNNSGELFNFRGAQLDGLILSGIDFRRVDLSHADMDNVKLNDALLQGAVLRRADLTDAKFGNANMKDTNLQKAKLNGAHLDLAKNLDDANLQGAKYGIHTKFPEGFDPGGHGMILDPTVTQADLSPPVAPPSSNINDTTFFSANTLSVQSSMDAGIAEDLGPNTPGVVDVSDTLQESKNGKTASEYGASQSHVGRSV